MRYVLDFILSGSTCIGKKTVLKQKDEVLCFIASSSGLKRNEDFRLQEITVALDGTT
jgi:hypothetical protein